MAIIVLAIILMLVAKAHKFCDRYLCWSQKFMVFVRAMGVSHGFHDDIYDYHEAHSFCSGYLYWSQKEIIYKGILNLSLNNHRKNMFFFYYM